MLDECLYFQFCNLMDFVNDRNPKAIYLADHLVGMPDYVKAASWVQPEDVADLADIAFANSGKREFPIHDKQATWLSAAYMLGDLATYENSTAYGRVKAAAVYHGIDADVAALEQAMAAHNKAASEIATPQAYALTVDFTKVAEVADQGIRNFYPLQDSYDVMNSARDMLNDFDRGNLPLDYLRSAAQELIKAAAHYGVEASDILPRVRAHGELRFPDFEHALTCVGLRKAAGVDDEGLELYKEAALGARDEPEDFNKWIDLWLDLDSTYGIKYARHQPTPYEAFFCGEAVPDLNKLASEVVVIEGVMVPKTVVALIPEIRVQQNFSKVASEKICAAQKVAAENPEQATSLLEEITTDERKEFLSLLAS
jgi:hypothetical protein